MSRDVLTSLTLLDYSDREFLFIVRDHQEEKYEGYARTQDIAETLAIDAKHPNVHVGIRLGWLRRYDGVVEKHPKKQRLWRLSAKAENLLDGRLTAAQQAMLAEAEAGRLLMLTRALTACYADSPGFAAHMMRREWIRGTARNGAVRRVEEPALTGAIRRVHTGARR